MPEPITTEALPAMIGIIDDFCRDVKSHTDGKPSEDNGLVQSINSKREGFKTAILSLSPNFKPYDLNEEEIEEFTQAELSDGEGEDPVYSKDSLSLHIDEVTKKITKYAVPLPRWTSTHDPIAPELENCPVIIHTTF